MILSSEDDYRRVLSSQVLASMRVGPQAFDARLSLIESGGSTFLATGFFRIGDTYTPSPYVAKLLELRARHVTSREHKITRTFACTRRKQCKPKAINTDIRQIRVLIEQADNAMDKAVSDGDMTRGDADTLDDLLAQSMGGLTVDDLARSVTFLTAACAMFD